MTETVTEVCDRWLAVAAKRSMFSADELMNMLLDIRNAHERPLNNALDEIQEVPA